MGVDNYKGATDIATSKIIQQQDIDTAQKDTNVAYQSSAGVRCMLVIYVHVIQDTLLIALLLYYGQ